MDDPFNKKFLKILSSHCHRLPLPYKIVFVSWENRFIFSLSFLMDKDCNMSQLTMKILFIFRILLFDFSKLFKRCMRIWCKRFNITYKHILYNCSINDVFGLLTCANMIDTVWLSPGKCTQLNVLLYYLLFSGKPEQ